MVQLDSRCTPECHNQIAFEGSVPDISIHEGKFAILIEPIPDDKIGRACLAGVCIVEVDHIQDTDDRASIIDGDTAKLESNKDGSTQLLFIEPSLGVRWAIVRLGVSPPGTEIVTGNLQLTMTQGQTVSMTLDGGGTQDVQDTKNQIPSTTTLNLGNGVTATRGSPGLLISYQCDAITNV